jgi:long-chain-fatty-acid--CoA ligase ACSBG
MSKEVATELPGVWTTLPDGYLEPKIGTSGEASKPAKTVIEVFKKTVANFGSENALALKRAATPGDALPTEYKFWTWQEYYDDSLRFAKALFAIDVPLFGIVNILGFNSPEWFMANNGSILAGAIAAGIYATNLPDACKYVTDHSKAQVVVVDGNKQLAKYSKIIATLPEVKALVVYGNEEIDATIKSGIEKSSSNAKVYSWDAFLALGDKVTTSAVEDRTSKGIKPGHCCSLIYTSGTTGNPKAVMISHDNITWTSGNMVANYVDCTYTDRMLSYLPLSHIAAQLLDIHVPIQTGVCVYFAQPDALKGSLTVSLKEMEPTLFFGVPRVWEKIHEKMASVGRSTTGLKKAISSYAKGLAADKNARAQFGGDNGSSLLFGCVSSIVLSKIKEAIGMAKCRACFTAAAPISKETLEYFASLDIPVYEVFGQSECTGPQTISNAAQWKIGYCGRPMLGTESMIAPDTKELCYRGRHIFMGYMYMPDKTAETIDEKGYLHSGDVAEFDENDIPDEPKPSGFMKITGRIKELIITAGGENIPPVLIENEMKAAMLALSNCMVVGDRRKYLAMLVCLKCEMDLETGAPTDQLAGDSLEIGKSIGSDAKTLSEATVDPLWIKYLNEGMQRANKMTTSNAQVVQKWKMLPQDFSEKEGDLTPTMKLKRSVVTKKYATLIDEIYGSVGNV